MWHEDQADDQLLYFKYILSVAVIVLIFSVDKIFKGKVIKTHKFKMSSKFRNIHSADDKEIKK